MRNYGVLVFLIYIVNIPNLNTETLIYQKKIAMLLRTKCHGVVTGKRLQ